jgi:hypothetical protein
MTMPKEGNKDRKALVCDGSMGQSSDEEHEHQNWGKKALAKGYATSSGRPTPIVCLPMECSRRQLTIMQYPNNPRPTTATATATATTTTTTTTASTTQAKWWEDEEVAEESSFEYRPFLNSYNWINWVGSVLSAFYAVDPVEMRSWGGGSVRSFLVMGWMPIVYRLGDYIYIKEKLCINRGSTE